MPGALVAIPHDHPAFAGHFPGQPLLPGVSLLAEVLEAVRAAEAQAGADAAWAAGLTVPVVKFLHPVRPGDVLRIEWAPRGPRVGFEVWVRAGEPAGEGLPADPPAEVLAASGQLEVRA